MVVTSQTRSDLQDSGKAAGAMLSRLRRADPELWDRFPPMKHDEARRRLEAVLQLEAGAAAASAAAHGGVAAGRLYQIARAWREERSLGALGLGPPPGAPRRGRRTEDGSELKTAAVARMRELAEADPTIRTGEVVATVTQEMRSAVSTKTLMNWWGSLRREVPVGVLGRRLAFDFCRFDLMRPGGGLHTAACVVDRDARVVLGAVALACDPDTWDGAGAARDAVRRLRRAGLDRMPGADRLARVSIAIAGNPVESMRFISALRVTVRQINVVGRPELFGLPTREAAGPMLGDLPIIAGARGGRLADADRLEGAEIPHGDFEARLAKGMRRHRAALGERLGGMDPTPSGEAGVSRIEAFLKRIALN